MTQTPSAFKALLLAVVLLSAWADVTLADDGAAASDRVPLYACGTGDDAASGSLQLTGVARADDNSVFEDLRFERLAADGQPVWSFPPAGVAAKAAFLFSHSDGPEGYLVTIRFADAGTGYTLYSLATPPDPDDEVTIMGAAGGLVSARDGKLVDDIECGESPYEFIDYMRRSMSCDTANPYGPAACEEYEAKRTAPIEVGRIGLD
jgi:hypothetical protein